MIQERSGAAGAGGEQPHAERERQRQRPRQEERRLEVGSRVRGQPLEADPGERAARQRQHRRAIPAGAADLPREQGEHEREQVVDEVPFVEQAADQHHEREQKQRVALADGAGARLTAALEPEAATRATPTARIKGCTIPGSQGGVSRHCGWLVSGALSG